MGWSRKRVYIRYNLKESKTTAKVIYYGINKAENVLSTVHESYYFFLSRCTLIPSFEITILPQVSFPWKNKNDPYHHPPHRDQMR